jgi:uncharacterized protein involved in exopolysaccharide biosynthesis
MNEKNTEINAEQLKKEVKEELLKREILMGLEEDEIDLFELFRVLVKHWKLVIVFPFMVAVATALYSLTLPNHFKSSATIFVHSGGGKMQSLLTSLPLGGMLGGVGGGGSAEYLMAYLKSRSMTDRIIQRFGIATHPAIVGENPPEEIIYDKTVKKVNNIVSVDKDKDGLITVAVETLDPKVSAEIASAYLEFLGGFASGPQREKRLFIQRQLKKVRKELVAAENELKEFQSKHKVLSMEQQASALIEKLAKLEGEKVEAEIKLNMQNSLLKASGNVPELVKIEGQKVSEEARLDSIAEEISLTEEKLVDVPDLSLEFVRLKRNLKVKEKVFGVLTEQYEMAKIAEAEEVNQFEVIDKPVPPELKSKPRRSIMVILAGLSAGVLGVFASFLIEFINRRKEQERKSPARTESV